jgi:hypothetical protein
MAGHGQAASRNRPDVAAYRRGWADVRRCAENSRSGRCRQFLRPFRNAGPRAPAPKRGLSCRTAPRCRSSLRRGGKFRRRTLTARARNGEDRDRGRRFCRLSGSRRGARRDRSRRLPEHGADARGAPGTHAHRRRSAYPGSAASRTGTAGKTGAAARQHSYAIFALTFHDRDKAFTDRFRSAIARIRATDRCRDFVRAQNDGDFIE